MLVSEYECTRKYICLGGITYVYYYNDTKHISFLLAELVIEAWRAHHQHE